MPGQTNNPGDVIIAGAALAAFVLVKHDGTVTAGDATRDWVAVTQEAATAAGQTVACRYTKAGTCILTAQVAITKGAVVFKDENGRVGLTGANARVGIALEAASGAGSQIEVLPD